jgi:hypothetical protein
MKFINNISDKELKTKKSTELLFDVKANLIDTEDEAYAKSVSVELGEGKIQRKYFIRTYNNVPLDPLGSTSRRNVWNRTSLKIVSFETFDNYLSYLKTNNALFFTKTNRSFING